ncbi:MAG: GTP-binding protein [Candidatus Thorarchaeota archaeon]
MSGTIRRQFKICLIGDGYVGKTSARRKFLDKSFKTNYIPTLGVDFARKTVTYRQYMTDLIIWDIAGQPLFQNLRKRYYDGAHGLILVYSVVNRESFDNARQWLVEAKGFMGKLPPLIIAGNKTDLRARYSKEETVTTDEGIKFTEDISLEMRVPAYFIETSALTGDNIDKAFRELAKMMLGIEDIAPAKPEPQPTPSPSTKIDLSETTAEEPIQYAAPQSHTEPVAENDTVVVAASNEARALQPDLDPVTSMTIDTEYTKGTQVGEAMSQLALLREELKITEDALSEEISELEKQLVTLKNTVHVKKIMYEHLKQQLAATRQEWSDAYAEYTKVDQRRKDQLTRRSRQIEDLRSQIDLVGKEIRGHVDELDLKRMRKDQESNH